MIFPISSDLGSILASRWCGSLAATSAVALALWLGMRSARLRALVPARLRYWVWWIVCLRFALFFAPAPSIPVPVALAVPPHVAHWLVSQPGAPSAASLQTTVPRRGGAAAGVDSARQGMAAHLPQLGSTAHATRPTTPQGARERGAAPPLLLRAPLISNRILGESALLVWAFGSALCLLRSIAATWKVRRLIGSARPVRGVAALQVLEEAWGGTGQSPCLLEHEAAGSPLALSGIWTGKVIVLPGWMLGEAPELLRSVLAHEARHLRCRDPWLALVPLLCRTMLWWLPSAGLAARECARCAEEDCDAQAVAGAGPMLTRRYGEILIRIASGSRGGPVLIGAECLSPSYRTLRDRLAAIKAGGVAAGPAARAAAAGLAALLALAAAMPRVTLSAASAIGREAASGAQPSYELVDLGPAGSWQSAAEAINDAGDVAGYETLPGSRVLRGVVWRSGSVQAVSANLGFPASRVVAIDGHGDVAVSAFGMLKFQHAAVVEQDGGVTPLQAIDSYPYATAVALGEGGTAAGYAYASKKYGKLRSMAVVWRGGSPISLGTLGGASSQALGLSGRGEVVGKADRAQPGVTHAFYLAAGSRSLIDLGALRDHAGSAAYAVNRSGSIVGYSATDDPLTQHAVVWSGPGARPRDIGTLSPGGISKARAINAAGEIVGVSTRPGGSGARATLWRGGRIYDLNSQVAGGLPVGWTLRYAVGINNAGQIVGVGQKDGTARAFLLNPAQG